MYIKTRELVASQKYNKKFSRLDLVVRYIFLEAMHQRGNIGYKEAKELYVKMQTKRSGTNLHRNGNTYVDEFVKLANSFENQGYIHQFPLIVNDDNHLIDSSHRTACSIYYGINQVPIQTTSNWKKHLTNPNPVKQTYFDYGLDWFKRSGFSEYEIDLIENKRKEIFRNLDLCFQVILWSPAIEYFQDIENDIRREYDIIDIEYYDLKEKYEEFVKEIYKVDDIADWKVNKKLEHMKSNSEVAVITLDLFSAEFRPKTQNKNKKICVQVEKIKKDIREKYRGKIDNYFYDTIIHIGDNYDHSEHTHVVLKKYRNYKLSVSHMLELSGTLSSHNIDKKDVCIVGSASMAAATLRKNNDIDIVLKSQVRDKLFSEDSQNLSKNIELVSKNWFFCDDGISDDDIVENDLHHNIFCGYKFVDLSLLKKRKEASSKKKDIPDIELIEGYCAS